jgi:hypothetical protein
MAITRKTARQYPTDCDNPKRFRCKAGTVGHTETSAAKQKTLGEPTLSGHLDSK